MFENEFVQFWIDGNILNCKYKDVDYIDLKASKSIVELRRSITQENIFLCFTDITKIGSISKEAKIFLAQDENLSGISKVAFLVNSATNKLIANFFILINNPKIPCRVFTNKEEARKWLQTK